ncbi:MAG: GLUG motif-containing protein, partial [Planctomycetota bacterium]
MRMRMASLRLSCEISTFLLLAAVCASSICMAGTYSGGDGSKENPYLISDANDMQAIGADPNDWDSHFKLTDDIDLSSFTGTSFNIIGSLETKFTGVFNGNRHIILNFTYNSSYSYTTGLFGYVSGPNAEIKELGLHNTNIDVGTGHYVGPLAGSLGSGSKITACYSLGGTVAGYSSVGGLVGDNLGNITSCYSTTSTTGNSFVGGLVGYALSGRIHECYATGKVTASGTSGGLTGGPSGADSTCFWDTQSTGQTWSAGGVGKTTAEMHDPNTFMSAGWDFIGAPDGPHDIWAEPAGGGYPILYWQLPPTFGLPSFSGGTGAPGDAFLISTSEEINQIGHNPRLMHSHFKLIDDIDLTGMDFYIIGGEDFYPYDTYPFAGVFDGNYQVISNFTHISADRDKVGLFGYIDGISAQIKNLGLNDPNVFAGSKSYVGTLAGQLIRGTISNSFAQNGRVSGNGNNIGGLVGYNEGEIVNCGTMIDVSKAGLFGGNDVGGLIGLNSGTITDCSAGGSLIGNSRVGGLVGKNTNRIILCYSICNVEAYNAGGGLVGENQGEIIRCWANGNISKGRYLGG